MDGFIRVTYHADEQEEGRPQGPSEPPDDVLLLGVG
jgi:hypothetical protein